MKNLFFKELKLSIHPLCYLFCILFGLMGLIPNYPAFVGPIYSIVAYTFLFLGANKGQTTNDLFYSCNLPIRKQDVVKARIVSITFLKFLIVVPSIICLLVRFFVIYPLIKQSGGNIPNLGLDINQGFALYAILLFCLCITDLIYLPWFYKTGKSVMGPTLVGVITYALLSAALTMFLPQLGNFMQLVTIGGPNESILIQCAVFFGCLIVSIGLEILTYFISVKNLNKLDF